MGAIDFSGCEQMGLRRGVVVLWSMLLGLGWGMTPALAATQIQLQFEQEAVTISLDELEEFAIAGTLPSSFDRLPANERTKAEVERTKLKEALEEIINLDEGEWLTLNSLSDEERELFEILIPDLTDETLREISGGLSSLGNGKSILDFLRSFPGETITPTHFVDTLVAVAPIESEPDQPKPEAEQAGQVDELDVLWYGYGENSTYNQQIEALAAAAPRYDPWGDGSLDWNLTFWNADDPAPDFSEFDVLAIGSAFRIPHIQMHFEAARLYENRAAIEAARGSRTFLSGQDADIHFMLTHGFEADGPFGFLVNAVNWAGSGTGLGILSLVDGIRGSRWWLHEGSFLKDELSGYVAYGNTNDVRMPLGTVDFPVNEGLTTAGLSDPGTNVHFASHAGFLKTIPGYRAINDWGASGTHAVTIVTASEANGGTHGKVPEPAAGWGVLGVLSLGWVLLRRQQGVG